MTHEFTPDWKLSQQDQIAVALTIALAKHVPGWLGATDEQLAAVAGDLVAAMEAALEAERLEERERVVNKLLPVKEMLAQACASDWPLSGADVANRLIEAGFLTVAEFADLVEPHDQDCAAAIRSRETDNG